MKIQKELDAAKTANDIIYLINRFIETKTDLSEDERAQMSIMANAIAARAKHEALDSIIGRATQIQNSNKHLH